MQKKISIFSFFAGIGILDLAFEKSGYRKTIDAECEVLQVEYQSRQYIANEVLNLCSFNSDGQCRISLSAPLGLDQEQLIPNYMTTYYSKLQHFFNSVKTLRIHAEDAFEEVILKNDNAELNLELGKKVQIVKARKKVYLETY